MSNLDHLGQTAVYRLYAEDRRLLYVGVGSDPAGRFRDHATARDWWPDVHHYDIDWFPTTADALEVEAHAIATENPVHNIRPGNKTSKPAPKPGEVHVPLRIARDNAGQFIDAAHYAGEITIVTRQGEPWAAIVPLDAVKAERGCGPPPDTHTTG